MKKVICAIVLVCSSVHAETDEILTWPESLQAARLNNPTLTAAGATVEKSRYDYKSARSVYFPTLDGNASYNYGESRTDDNESSGDASSAGVDARYTLFSGGANIARVDLARASLRVAEANWFSSLADVGSTLKENFARLLYAQEDIKLTRQITTRRKQNVDLVELRYESGKEHKGSFLRTRATYRDAVSEEHRAQRGLDVAQRNVAASLGRRYYDVVVADGRFDVAAITNEPDFNALLANTPDHIRSEAQLLSADASVRLAKSPFYPELSTHASASRNGEGFSLENDAWSVGVALSFPFYAGNKYVNDLASARVGLQIALANQQESDDQTLVRLESAWADLQDALDRRDVQRDFLEAAEVRAEIARSQYAGGLLSFEDWDQIEDDLTSAQTSMLSSERDTVLAEAAWERAQGINLFLQP